MSTTDLTTFYASAAPGTTGTFGDVMSYVRTQMSTTWTCAADPCTKEELAPLQWGASKYTQMPLTVFGSVTAGNGFVDNTSTSMCDWAYNQDA